MIRAYSFMSVASASISDAERAPLWRWGEAPRCRRRSRPAGVLMLIGMSLIGPDEILKVGQPYSNHDGGNIPDSRPTMISAT